MQNTLRLVARVRGASSVLPVPRLYPLPITLVQPLLTPCSPRIPTLVACLQQPVERFSCGTCPPSKSKKDEKGKSAEKGKQCTTTRGKSKESKKKGKQCSEVKGKRGESEEKGGQCMTVKGKGKSKDKGEQCSSVKGKRGGSKEKGGQCRDVKGKRGKSSEKGKQCTEVKGKTDKNKGKGAQCTEVKGRKNETAGKRSSDDSSCSVLNSAKDIAKAKTVICEGEDGKDHGCKPSKKEEELSSSSSSSSSSSDSESQDEEGKKDESSEDENPPLKQCPDEPIDPHQEEKNAKAVTEMCACIQAALAQTNAGQKGGDARGSQQRDISGRPPSCGALPKQDSKPKISEHVKCCQVETSNTAPLKSGTSSCNVKKESSGKEGTSKGEECANDNGEGGGKGDLNTKNDPCECIKKALNKCKEVAPKEKAKGSKKSAKKDKKSAKEQNKSDKKSRDKPDKEETSSEEEDPSQCGPQDAQCGPQDSKMKTKTFGKKDCKSKEFTVKCR